MSEKIWKFKFKLEMKKIWGKIRNWNEKFLNLEKFLKVSKRSCQKFCKNPS
jgi:hypothetical protein